MNGGTRCRMHGGSIPAVRAKAKERVLETNLRGELVRRGWEPVTDPLAAVQDLAGEKLAWLDMCRDEVARLRELDVSSPTLVDVKPRVALYERAWSDAFGAVAGMVKLGIEARVADRTQTDAQWLPIFARELVHLAREHPDRTDDEIFLMALAKEKR